VYRLGRLRQRCGYPDNICPDAGVNQHISHGVSIVIRRLIGNHKKAPTCEIEITHRSVTAARFEVLTGGDPSVDQEGKATWLDPDDVGRAEGTDYVPLPIHMLDDLRVNLAVH
jgi:hypothetical protein